MLQTKTKSTGESHVVHIVVLPLVVQWKVLSLAL
jgi:hypothetical protein